MKWIEVLINLIFWLVSGWFICSSFSIQAQEIEIVNDQELVRIVRNETILRKLLLSIGLSFTVFYTNIWNISKFYHSAPKIKAIAIGIGLFISSILLFSAFESFLFEAGSIRLPKAIGIGILTFYFTISSAYGIVKILVQSEKRQQLLLLAKKQAELNLLRNQLQPHFLFNALNNLLAMVEQQQSPQLARAFDKLSQLLRYVIEETKNQRVALEKEIQFIRNYAALQLLRFEENEVDFNFSIHGEQKNQYIEPGLLIPFVENAFKYGTEPEKQSKIDLTLELSKPNEIKFSIRNKKLNYTQNYGNTGTGIRATRERLELVYPAKHRLEITEKDDYLVELTIRIQ